MKIAARGGGGAKVTRPPHRRVVVRNTFIIKEGSYILLLSKNTTRLALQIYFKGIRETNALLLGVKSVHITLDKTVFSECSGGFHDSRNQGY